VLDAPVDVILDRATVVQPDLLFVSRERLGIITERAVEGTPDLAVEILSEHGAARDLGYKHQLYARHGVQHYWVVDPDGKSLAEHVLSERAYSLRGTCLDSATCTTALFPELAIDVQAIFR
jgi:Uma2 family endonuclease